MPLSTAEIQKLATLSRLRFDETALQKFSSEFDNIIQFIEKIGEAKTEGVPPLTTTAGESTGGALVSTPERVDVVSEENRREAYQQHPAHAADGSGPRTTESGFYVVPKIVE